MEASNSNKSIFSILDDYTEKIENGVMGLGMIAISIIVFSNVITRYFFNFSLVWSEELSRYIVVWVTFFGISSCARYEEHVKIDLLLNTLKGVPNFILTLTIRIISLVTSIYLSYISILFTIKQFSTGNKSIAIAIPIWAIYLSSAIGFVLLSYVYARKLYKLIANKREGAK